MLQYFMASTGKILHNQKRLKLAKNAISIRQELKQQLKDTANIADKLKIIFKLDKNPNKSMTRYRRRCQLCGRPRGVIHGDVCRIHFRQMANFGQLSGVKKASW